MIHARLFLAALALGCVLPACQADIAISIDRNVSVGVSRIRPGVTHTKDTCDTAADRPAGARAKVLLRQGAVFQAQAIMGWGAGNPWPLSTGPMDWKTLDRRVALMRETGAMMCLTLCAAPDWMKGGVDGKTDWTKIEVAPLPERVGDFAQLCRAVAERYPDVHFFQVWNEMKGMWGTAPGASPGAAGRQRWDYERYMTLYNAVYDAIKAVNPEAQLGGPYVVIGSTSERKSYSNPTRRSYGYLDQRSLDVVAYWLQHKRGGSFICLDGNTKNKDGVWITDEFTAGEKFRDAIAWVRALDEAQYPGARSLPIWWAEWYSSAPAKITDPEHCNAMMASNLIQLVLGGSDAVFLWQPEGDARGLSFPLGLWTDDDVAGGGTATPYFETQRGLLLHFAPGTPLFAARSSSQDIGVLAGANRTLLVNRTAAAQTALVNGAPYALAPYDVKFVPTP